MVGFGRIVERDGSDFSKVSSVVYGTIGLATEMPDVGREWSQIIQAHGYSVTEATVRGPLPIRRVDLWVVVLDPRTAPSRMTLWLRQFAERVVLVTPHLQAGQSLAERVPSLCLVCAPLQARTGISDVLALARTISSGLVTLTSPSQVHPCSH